MSGRPIRVLLVFALALLVCLPVTAPAAADPRFCVTYDFAGSELCVSDQGLEGADRFTPWDQPTWFCVIYTFSGAQICVSTDGQIEQQ